MLVRNIARGAGLAIVGMSVLALSACDFLPQEQVEAGSADARKAASEFVSVYYDESNVAGAIELTADPLKSKLTAEAAGIQSEGDDAEVVAKPKVTATLRETDVVSPTVVTFIWDVQAGDGPSLTAMTEVTDTNGSWLVTNLEETTDQ